MSPARAPHEVQLGELLGRWRASSGATQAEVRTRLASPTAAGALSMWERGRRRPPWPRLAELDAAYGACGALLDVAHALDTPLGLPARRVWAHNFRDGSGPVWAWLRPRRPGTLRATLRWGAFGIELRERCTERGLFLAVPVSMPNPAAWVFLREPGWVDFGRGRPPAALDIPIIEALEHAVVTDGPHSAAGLVTPAMGERYRSDTAFALAVQRLLGARPDVVDRVFRATTGWRRIIDVGTQPRSSRKPPGFSAAQYVALRAARHLSLREVADAATDLLPGVPVTDDHVRRLEAGGAPRVELLRSRLDTIYRADGHTCIERITPRRDASLPTRWVLEFPPFWVGPVWFRVDASAHATADTAMLEWGDDYLPLRVHSGRLLTCRRATIDAPSASISLPPEWSVTAAGVGMHEHAADVNWGWQSRRDPGDDTAPVNEHFLALFGRSAQDLQHLEGFIDTSAASDGPPR